MRLTIHNSATVASLWPSGYVYIAANSRHSKSNDLLGKAVMPLGHRHRPCRVRVPVRSWFEACFAFPFPRKHHLDISNCHDPAHSIKRLSWLSGILDLASLSSYFSPVHVWSISSSTSTCVYGFLISPTCWSHQKRNPENMKELLTGEILFLLC